VFDIHSNQKEVYEKCAFGLVDYCFNGYNGTIMAYGQTGSGKTFTMGSCLESKEEEKGIIPRTIDEVELR
jgi:type II secretory ATPase GspE/PulE/Tfp pilus assembly ATPase PilB-like protein